MELGPAHGIEAAEGSLRVDGLPQGAEDKVVLTLKAACTGVWDHRLVSPYAEQELSCTDQPPLWAVVCTVSPAKLQCHFPK